MTTLKKSFTLLFAFLLATLVIMSWTWASITTILLYSWLYVNLYTFWRLFWKSVRKYCIHGLSNFLLKLCISIIFGLKFLIRFVGNEGLMNVFHKFYSNFVLRQCPLYKVFNVYLSIFYIVSKLKQLRVFTPTQCQDISVYTILGIVFVY